MKTEHHTTLEEIAQKFADAIATLERELTSNILDGTPYALFIPSSDDAGAFKLMYGKTYPDQLAKHSTDETIGGNEYSFRLQRRFDLCGCLLMSDESSARNVGRAIKLEDGKTVLVERIHRRDWMREELAGLKRSLEHVKLALSKLPTA